MTQSQYETQARDRMIASLTKRVLALERIISAKERQAEPRHTKEHLLEVQARGTL